MAKHILPLMPEHTTYTESFFGGGAIFFLKPQAEVEIINDLNKEVINFYRTIIKDFDALQLEIQSTLHSHSSFDDAKLIHSNPHLFSEVKRAWAFFVLANQSFASDMKSFGFSLKAGRQICNSFNSKVKNFTSEYQQRLENVIVESDDALKVITRYDSPDTFHYVDPPYYNSNCKFYDDYSIAMFKTLLSTLSTIEGKFLLSSYPSDILTEYTTTCKWFTKEIKKEVSVNNGKNKIKTEVLTANYPI